MREGGKGILYILYFHCTNFSFMISKDVVSIGDQKKTVGHPYKRGCDYQMKYNKQNKHAKTS